ncbi:Snf7 family protein [Biscogniauxia marginata]|nr:Snf7 family protein [Biscogniauxia marginata]
MEGLKSLFVKPDPNAQMRKCNQLIRSNIRKLDRDIAQVKQVELKTKNLIIAADRRAARDPSRQRQAQKEARDFARELIRARRASSRLVTSKAQLSSVQMQVNEAFAVRKIEGSIRASVGIMRDVNSLVRLPQLAGTMQELSVELMKAGVIEEMVGESLPVDEAGLFEDEDAEADGEVDKVLGEILKGRMDKAGPMPSAPVAAEPVPAAAAATATAVEEDEEDQEAMMDQMRNRLEALRS